MEWRLLVTYLVLRLVLNYAVMMCSFSPLARAFRERSARICSRRIKSLVNDHGIIETTCDFCQTQYDIPLDEVLSYHENITKSVTKKATGR